MLPTAVVGVVLFLAGATFVAARYVITGRVGFGPPRHRSAVWPSGGGGGVHRNRPAPVANGYWGVEVQPGPKEGCCRFVERFRGVRFPIGDAPKLPLPGCDARQCQCRFEYLPERRKGSSTVVPEDRRGTGTVRGWSQGG